ncbi:hypothetical protein A3G16_02095 [Candidatus Curtissbacteria bacterium RIFCSPLOWO2_12_FULL_41_16]|nr:MAG: hypothetical protein A3G16_02095 [Candidatus Curtissbacteria bacterium RIFCSPLOWO2_12_FULL_41_16]
MRRKILFLIILLILIFVAFGIVFAISARGALITAKKAVGAAKLQDLNATKAYLRDTKRDLQRTQTILYVATPIRFIPILGWYVADAQRGIGAAIDGVAAASTFTEAITPYADVLGLAGEGTFLGGTAQERLAKAVETLSLVSPQIDNVGRDLARAKGKVEKIESWRYPNFLPGKPGEKVDFAKSTIVNLESIIVDTKPLLEVLPSIMGQDGEKKYLVLFQNDKELRPTGGFITAYAVFRIEKGIIASEGSSDIYNLDNTLLKRVPAPEPIIKYLPNVASLNLRDSNLSADYLSSMKTFEDLYAATADPKDIDGIIALDTQFVLTMMEVLGPIDAYGTSFTTEKVPSCDCEHIIYELERYADQPVAYEKGARKDIIGVLMQQMMDKAFNAPKSQWPNLLGKTIDSLRQKHLLLYFHDAEAQQAVERINFAGRVYEYDGDFLYINETNFAGAKSNLYVQEKVKQQAKIGKDGNLEKKITIEYKYPRRMDNCSLERQGGLCLAGIYRDWIRVYVPKGSTLTKASGTEVAITATEDLGKTVFEGFFTLRPEGTAKIEIEYTVPIKVDKQYKLLIQKQPGTQGHTYEIEAMGRRQKPFPLDTDKEIIFKL